MKYIGLNLVKSDTMIMKYSTYQ